MLSCDSLLAARLQHEELWRPTKYKYKQQKLASAVSVFTSDTANDTALLLQPPTALAVNPKLNSSAHLLVSTKDSHQMLHKLPSKRARLNASHMVGQLPDKASVQLGPEFLSSTPVQVQSQKLRLRRRLSKRSDKSPTSIPAVQKSAARSRKSVCHERRVWFF
jgi:hypothetical protein